MSGSAIPAILMLTLALALPLGASECQLQTDCLAGFEVCSEGLCARKGLLPLLDDQITGLVLLAISALLMASIGGIARGVFLAPILLLLFHFHSVQTIALLSALHCCSAGIAFCWQCRRRHPRKFRVLADYTTIGVALPPVLLGSLLGTTLATLLPQGLYVVLLGLALLFYSELILQHGLKLYRGELNFKMNQKRSLIEYYNSRRSPAPVDQSYPLIQPHRVNSPLLKIYINERTHLPCRKLLPSLIILGLIALTALLPSVLPGCGVLATVLRLSTLILGGACIYFGGMGILREEHEKEQLGYQFDWEDIQWSWGHIFCVSSLCFASAFLSATVGLGGDLFYLWKLFRIKLNVRVVEATAGYLVLVASLSNALQLALMGYMPWLWLAGLAVFQLTFSTIGVVGVQRLLRKSKWLAWVILSISALALISGVLVVAGFFSGERGGASFSPWEAAPGLCS